MLRRILRIIIGILAILVGFSGIVFPIIPGFVFFILGAILLSPEIPFLGRMICWTKERFPSTQKALGWVQKVSGKMGTDLPECFKQG